MPATYDADDYWAQAVTLFTGYALPSRKTLFDKLSSKEGIPLFRMDIQNISVRAVTADDYSALSGWGKSSGEDYDIAFYTSDGGDGAHDGVSMHKARIVFIGVPDDANGRARLLDPGELMLGGAFTGHYGDQWDASPMNDYVSGAKAALDRLLVEHSTRGFSYNGLSVVDAEAVDLKSFERTAKSFDRSMKFFVDHATKLQQWETSLGSEQSAWRGQAAGVFWHLVHQLRKNYDSYVDQLGGANYAATNTTVDGYTPISQFGDALAAAQRNLVTQATNLQNAWTAWASAGEHDPHRSLLEVLDKVTKWLLENNLHVQVSDNYDAAPTYSTAADFKQNHPEFGDLTDIQNWKKIGQAAVDQWNAYVNTQLVPTATTAIATLNGNWIDAGTAFEQPLKTKDTSSLADSYQQEKNDLATEAATKNSDDLNSSLNDLNSNLNSNLDNLSNNLNDLGSNFNNLNTGLNSSLNDINSGLNDSLSNINDGLGNNLNSINSGLNDSLSNLSTDLNSGLNSGLNGGLNGGTTGLGPPAGLAAATSLNDLNSGLGSLTNPGGSTTSLNADGSLTTTYPDGSTTTIDPSTGLVTTTSPNGKVITSNLKTGSSYTNPDGSVTTLNSDGTLTTKYPDGTTETLNPSDGVITTTSPDGKVTTTDLNGPIGSTGPTSPTGSLSGLTSLNGASTPTTGSLNGSTSDLASLGSGNSSPGSGTTSLNTGLSGYGSTSGGDLPYDEYDSTPYTSGALGAPSTASTAAVASAATSGNSGMPLNPGGMGGMGSGQGNSSSSERTRSVLTETGGATTRRSSRSRAATPEEEEEDIVLAGGRTVTTGSGTPMYPMGGQQGGQTTESNSDRQRNSWVPEDEDVWGTEDGGAPAVIGR